MVQRRDIHKLREEARLSLCSLGLLGFSYFSAHHHSPGTRCVQCGDCVRLRVCICVLHCVHFVYLCGWQCVCAVLKACACFIRFQGQVMKYSSHRILAQTHNTVTQLHTKYSICTAQFMRCVHIKCVCVQREQVHDLNKQTNQL